MNGTMAEFKGDTPVYLQLAERLKDAILSGAYAEEEQIPSITEFSVACNMNPATALKGVNILVDEELLYKKRGLGMFVKSGARDKLLQQRRENFYQTFIRPLVNEAAQLGITETDIAEMTKRGVREHEQSARNHD